MLDCHREYLCNEPIYLASFVLGDLVLSVLLAGLALAVGAASLGNVDLQKVMSAIGRSVCAPIIFNGTVLFLEQFSNRTQIH